MKIVWKGWRPFGNEVGNYRGELMRWEGVTSTEAL